MTAVQALALAAVIVAVIIGYSLHKSYFNKRVCPRCGGSKRIQGGFGTFRDCPRCRKTGEVSR